MAGQPGHDPRKHPWWQYVGQERRSGVLLRRLAGRLNQWITSQQGKLTLVLLLYLSIGLVLVIQGAGLMALLTGLPLLLLPPLAYLLYWLTWKEFHQ